MLRKASRLCASSTADVQALQGIFEEFMTLRKSRDVVNLMKEPCRISAASGVCATRLRSSSKAP